MATGLGLHFPINTTLQLRTSSGWEQDPISLSPFVFSTFSSPKMTTFQLTCQHMNQKRTSGSQPLNWKLFFPRSSPDPKAQEVPGRSCDMWIKGKATARSSHPVCKHLLAKPQHPAGWASSVLSMLPLECLLHAAHSVHHLEPACGGFVTLGA